MGYLGMVHFIANWTSEDIAAETQGFAFVLQQGAGVVALVVFGVLVGLFGGKAFFAAALLGLIILTVVVIDTLTGRLRRRLLEAR